MIATLNRLTITREWLAGLLSISLVFAPFGCEISGGTLLPGGGDDDDPLGLTSRGLFVNENVSDELLLAGRGAEGEYFVYGSRSASGALGEIDSVVVVDSNGAESFLAFESGRPVRAQGPDGSFVAISYESVSLDHLAAQVSLFDAASGETQAFEIDVNPLAVAADVASQVEELTGLDLPVVDPDAALQKTLHHQDVRVTFFSPLLLVAPFFVAIGLATVILGQIVIAVYALIAATLQSALLLALLPFFALAGLLDDTSVSIRPATLDEIFGVIPEPARF